MYPSPFCNLSQRHWMGGGVQVGCGADGAPIGRLMVPTAGGAGWRPVPAEAPPDTETPRQPPGHFGRRPNWANAAGEPPARFRGTLRSPPALGPAPGGDRCRRSPRQTRNPPPDTETPHQPPGHFGRRPNWANAAGEPPARFRGTLRPTPALGPTPTAVGAGW